jgi:DNA-binding winged helix-turn-helix (wHTH) protein/TolB-like protein/lipoprotein NlpI
MDEQNQCIYAFGPYVLNRAERRLWLESQPVPLEPKAFDTLVALVEKSGRLVSKEELMREVWPDTFVEEVNLARNISTLRKVLAPGFDGKPCIETVPKHGYRFVADVTLTDATTLASPAVGQKPEPLTPIASPLVSEEKNTPVGGRPVQRPAARWLYGGLALCLLIGGARLGWKKTDLAAVASEPKIKSIAVLPFKPLHEESREPFLEIGLADALITRLGNLAEITVRPTSAIRRYAEREIDSQAAGRELTVDSVLEGSLQQQGDRLRVTVRLLRVSDGKTLWSHQCDTFCSDIFQTQDTVSLKVAEALRPQLSAAEQPGMSKRGTNDAQAYQAYLKGNYFFNKRNRDDLRKAKDFFQEAIARDANYAQAYNGLSNAYQWLVDLEVEPPASLAHAHKALQQALALDPALPEAHATMGLNALNVDWDWKKAESEFQLAIKLNPNYATAHHWYGEYLHLTGRFDESLRELQRALEIDPLSLIINSDLAKYYYFARQYERAIAQAQHTLELDQNFFEPYYWLFNVHYQQGHFAEAQAFAEKLIRTDAGFKGDTCMVMVLAAQGRRAEAERIMARMSRSTLPQRSYFLALGYSALGDTDRALAWLEKAYAERSNHLLGLRGAHFDHLRNEPRFQKIWQDLRFPEDKRIAAK